MKNVKNVIKYRNDGVNGGGGKSGSDHVALLQKLELAFFNENSPGMVFWLPKGVRLNNRLRDLWREIQSKRGYQEISSPSLFKESLFLRSGHIDHYKDNMFNSEDMFLKPMNCPPSMLAFSSRKRSYKELPLRLSCYDALHRKEPSGSRNGLLRLMEFHQDDCHSFIREEQVLSEIANVLKLAQDIYSLFGLSWRIRIGLRPQKALGKNAVWDKAERALLAGVQKAVSKDKFEVVEGEGAFYAPKADFLVKDLLGREWQLGSLQLDYQLPMAFDLYFINEEGRQERPVVLHRAIAGSFERFLAILLESNDGWLPSFISEEQVGIAAVSQDLAPYADKVYQKIAKSPLRVAKVELSERLGAQIASFHNKRIKWVIILGEKEKLANEVQLRELPSGKGVNMPLKEAMAKIIKDVEIKI